MTGSLSLAADVYSRSVTLEWEPTEGAVTYELEVTRKPLEKEPEAKPVKVYPKETAFELKLEPGTYTMRVRSRDKRKVPGEWSAPEEFMVNLEEVVLKSPAKDATVQSKETEEQETKFEWAKTGGADHYLLQITSPDGKIDLKETLKTNQFKTKLPVAQEFKWSVIAVNPKGISSAEPSEAKFTLNGPKLEEPEIEVAENGFVREIKWSRPNYSENFSYNLQRYDVAKKEWVYVEKGREVRDSQIDFSQKWEGGNYRISLKANANNRVSSKLISKQFKVFGGDRSPASEFSSTMRQAFERTRGWYLLASYLVTNMDYKGQNSDNRYNVLLNVAYPSQVGGTGRLGAGYLSEETPWGFISSLDITGFQVADQNPVYMAMQADGVYRTDVGSRGEIRQQFGLFYKEMPEIIATNTSTIDRIDKIVGAGPHYGIEYWFALSPKLGLQANAHFYQTMMTLKTPNGQPLKPTLTYQFGLLGSYRFSNRMTGLMGYANRKDSASYQSNRGSDNTVDISGHYLNLFMEWAL